MPRIYFSPSTQEHNAGVVKGYIEETEMNLIADIAIPLLQFNGITVYRNKPTMDHISSKNESNSLKVDAHFALHSNAGGGEGTVAFTSGSEKGSRLARCVYDEVAVISPSKDRGVIIPTKKFTEVFATDAPATLIEVAFHDNLADAMWIQANRQEIAEAICRGLCKYFGITFTMPKVVNRVTAPEGFIYRVYAGAYRYEDNAQIMVEALAKVGIKAHAKLEPK